MLSKALLSPPRCCTELRREIRLCEIVYFSLQNKVEIPKDKIAKFKGKIIKFVGVEGGEGGGLPWVHFENGPLEPGGGVLQRYKIEMGDRERSEWYFHGD